MFCHEYDHLEGILYSDIAKDMMTVEEYSRLLEEAKAMHEDDEEAENSDVWELRSKESI